MIACARMVLEFFGLHVTEDELLPIIQPDEVRGTALRQLEALEASDSAWPWELDPSGTCGRWLPAAAR